MSAGETKTWLVCYDIREARRLRRVHRLLRGEGLAIQYSAFSVRANDAGIKGLLSLIDEEIKPEDDVRAYHIPEQCPVWTLGRSFLPEGIMLTPTHVIGLFSSQLAPDQSVPVKSVLFSV